MKLQDLHETAGLTLKDAVRSPVHKKKIKNLSILLSSTRKLFTGSPLFLLIETCTSSCHYTATFIVSVTAGNCNGQHGKIVGRYVRFIQYN